MSVRSPRAYAAYARDVPTGGGPACSGSAPDRRPLRARVAFRLRLLVRLSELPHHLVAPLVQSLEPPLLSFGERERGEDGDTEGIVEVAHDRDRQLVGVHLPPAHGFGGGRWTPTSCRARSCATSTIPSVSPSSPRTRSPNERSGGSSDCTSGARR